MTNSIILKVKTKNITRFLTNLYKLNIEVLNVNIVNHKELIIEVCECDYDKVCGISILNKVNIVDYRGKNKVKRFINKNKVLFISLIINLFILVFLSNVIFSIEIKHESSEVRNLVITELKKYNIKKYTLKKNYTELDSIKNKILNNNKDKIEWIEINTSGCKYVVKVVMRKLNSNNKDDGIYNIVSNSNAVIKKIVAENGSIVREVNEYVYKGDILISSEIKLNDEIKGYKSAKGVVYGEVWYKMHVIMPYIYMYRTRTGKSLTNYSVNFFNKSLIIGKKFKNSEIDKHIIFSNNIIPISITKNKEYEINDSGDIQVPSVAYLNALSYSKGKMEEKLGSDEYIISSRVLKKDAKSNTIELDIFYKVYKKISVNSKIEGTK